jgi:hypothetical protein
VAPRPTLVPLDVDAGQDDRGDRGADSHPTDIVLPYSGPDECGSKMNQWVQVTVCGIPRIITPGTHRAFAPRAVLGQWFGSTVAE